VRSYVFAHTYKMRKTSATTLSAGTLKPPPMMVRTIQDLVRKTFASWSLSIVTQLISEVEKQIALLAPSADTSVPPPKITPAMMKRVREICAQIASGEVSELVRRRLRSLYPDLKLDAPDSIRLAGNLESAKNFEAADDDAIAFAQKILRVYSEESTAARDAVIALRRYLQDVSDVERRKGGSSDHTTDMNLMAANKRLNDMQAFTEYLSGLGGQGFSGIKRTTKGKLTTTKALKDATSVKVEVPVDLSGLPANYPKSASFPSIFLHMVPMTNVNGAWQAPTKTLTITVNEVPTSRAMFDKEIATKMSTVKHELEHMVQTIMAEELESKGKKAAATRVGTPYNSKHGALPESYAMNFERVKKSYPDVTEREAYYLDPREFFPQIESAVGYALHSYNGVAGDSKGLLLHWKQLTGLAPSPTMFPFYKSLKKYDNRLYKRAVVEGWDEISRSLS
jgi:hypothetical protein